MHVSRGWSFGTAKGNNADLLVALVAGAEYGARKERRAYLWAERKAARSEVCVSECFELRKDPSIFGLRGKDRPRRLLKL